LRCPQRRRQSGTRRGCRPPWCGGPRIKTRRAWTAHSSDGARAVGFSTRVPTRRHPLAKRLLTFARRGRTRGWAWRRASGSPERRCSTARREGPAGPHRVRAASHGGPPCPLIRRQATWRTWPKGGCAVWPSGTPFSVSDQGAARRAQSVGTVAKQRTTTLSPLSVCRRPCRGGSSPPCTRPPLARRGAGLCSSTPARRRDKVGTAKASGRAVAGRLGPPAARSGPTAARSSAPTQPGWGHPPAARSVGDCATVSDRRGRRALLSRPCVAAHGRGPCGPRPCRQLAVQAGRAGRPCRQLAVQAGRAGGVSS